MDHRPRHIPAFPAAVAALTDVSAACARLLSATAGNGGCVPHAVDARFAGRSAGGQMQRSAQERRARAGAFGLASSIHTVVGVFLWRGIAQPAPAFWPGLHVAALIGAPQVRAGGVS